MRFDSVAGKLEFVDVYIIIEGISAPQYSDVLILKALLLQQVAKQHLATKKTSIEFFFADFD